MIVAPLAPDQVVLPAALFAKARYGDSSARAAIAERLQGLKLYEHYKDVFETDVVVTLAELQEAGISVFASLHAEVRPSECRKPLDGFQRKALALASVVRRCELDRESLDNVLQIAYKKAAAFLGGYLRPAEAVASEPDLVSLPQPEKSPPIVPLFTEAEPVAVS